MTPSFKTPAPKLRCLRWAATALATACAALATQAAPPASPTPLAAADAASTAVTEIAPPTDAAPPSSLGQRIYSQTKPRLLQVRTLLKTQDSQSSVGSGFW
ncbi:hypothetical protein [Ideonella paludis]|uniref:hypothetical protein n=1 Tax=Ideonella paludis TaxID=1233411 RepID=UPI003645495C